SRVAMALRDEACLLEDAPKQLQRVGRPSQPVRLAGHRLLLGFSISDITDGRRKDPGLSAHVSTLRGVATTLDGTPVESTAPQPLTVEDLRDPVQLTSRILDEIDWLTDRVGVDRIVGLGVGLGGVIDRGVVRRSCNLAWLGTPVRLEESLRAVFPSWH